VLRLRQGNIAYTLLQGGFYGLIHLLQVLNVNLSSTKLNNLFNASSVSLIVLNGPAQKPFLLLKDSRLP
jgi:hypothetical protein